MNAQVALALATGIVAGGVFAALEVPIPAPPNVAGVMGIVGLYLGYKLITQLGYTIDLLGFLSGLF